MHLPLLAASGWSGELVAWEAPRRLDQKGGLHTHLEPPTVFYSAPVVASTTSWRQFGHACLGTFEPMSEKLLLGLTKGFEAARMGDICLSRTTFYPRPSPSGWDPFFLGRPALPSMTCTGFAVPASEGHDPRCVVVWGA